jgi:ParB family chromosome partitioning protein
VAKKKTVKRRKRVSARSVGLSAPDTAEVNDAATNELADQIVEDGGAVLAKYREPFGGTPAVLATLPIERVEPTPYQRDPSDAHVKRLMTVIETLGRFLDPIITIRHDAARDQSGAGGEAPAQRRSPGGVQGAPPIKYWTPNGNHRLQAMRKLGAKSVVALVVPDAEVAFKILALNTEKAHNLKEKSLETIRMLRALADERPSREEREFAFEFDQPAFLTLGAAYEERPRLSGGAYQSVLRRIDDFLDTKLPAALKERVRRAAKIVAIDDEVGKIVDKLKKRGFTSPYLRPFVVARINPIRFSTSTEFDFDDVVGRMQKNAAKFNVDKVKQEDVVRTGGGPVEED